MSRILFVCTGNTCRSPMAAELFNLLARETGKQSRADSCGLSVPFPMPAAQEAVAAAAARGFDLSAHRARPVSAALLADTDQVYGMTQAHLRALAARFPEYQSKLSLLPCGQVPDPYGGDGAVYAACLRALEPAVRAVLARLP